MECVLRAIFARIQWPGSIEACARVALCNGTPCVYMFLSVHASTHAHLHTFIRDSLPIYFGKYTRRCRILNIEYYDGEDVHSCLSRIETTGETEYRKMSYANRRRSRFREYLTNLLVVSYRDKSFSFTRVYTFYNFLISYIYIRYSSKINYLSKVIIK